MTDRVATDAEFAAALELERPRWCELAERLR